MSYEGFTEHLCKNGHYWSANCYDERDQEVCTHCDGPSVWRHAVDQTNGICTLEDGTEDPSTVSFPLEIDHYESRVIKVPVYKVPGNKANSPTVNVQP